jgi:hypothetical protein
MTGYTERAMKELAIVGCIVGILAWLGFLTYFMFTRSRKRVQRWADENGFTLNKCEWHFSGAATFEEEGGWRIIWTVRTTDREGVVRDAWVGCGHPLIGMLSDKIEVTWLPIGKSAFR